MKSCWYGVTVGARCGEALGTPFSRTARYKFRSAIPFMAGLESGVPSVDSVLLKQLNLINMTEVVTGSA